MRHFKYLLLIAAAFVIASACGKKTDPTVLTEAVPTPSETLRIFNNDEGVVISNNDRRFPLVVERAVFDPECGCLSEYKEVTEIYPSSSYIDRNVEPDVRYVYNVTAVHPVYGNSSQPAKRAVIYSKPVKITDVQMTGLSGDRYSFTLETDKPFERIEAFVDGQLEARTSRNTFDVNLSDKQSRIVSIYPFDKYGNTGEEKTVTVAQLQQIPEPPLALKSIYGGSTLTLSWDEPQGAWLYNVYLERDGVYSFLGKVDVPFFMYTVGRNTADCLNFAVSSAVNGQESAKSEHRACW